MKNIADILSMVGFFICSYLGWLIFKQKYDLINEPNQGGFFGYGSGGFGQNYNAHP